MCGICGIINFDQSPVSAESIQTMMAIQKHRGPDDDGVFVENNIGLGFVRLSILDLSSAGHQPMFSADDRYVAVYNGEIFNYIELREELKALGHPFKSDTDTEVLLCAYQQWGEACLHRFNGMWAFVIYDRQEKTIFAARDRYGIKPFYYYLTDSFLAFASEIPPLLRLLPGKPEPDQQSIFDYLVFNRTDQTERTFFSDIKKLQHGHCFSLNPADSLSALPIRKWYDLRNRVTNAEGFETPNAFYDMFSSAVGLRLRSDVPVGVCLSGGLDSSSIVSVLLKEYQQKDLNTFSAVYPPGWYGDESEFINLYRPELKHMFFTTPDAMTLQADLATFVRAHAEPIPSTSPYAQFKVMALAKDHVVVTLDGQGADEELAGYHYFYGFYYKDLLRQGRVGKLAKEIRRYVNIHHSLYGIKTFLYFLLPQKLRTLARINEKGYLNHEFAHAYQSRNTISGSLYSADSLKDALLDHFEYKLEHLLKWEDRNSMWFSLEARVPFLDHRLVEKILAAESDMIIRNGETKYILRQAMKGVLPEAIRTRQDKMGFETPQDQWFRTKTWQKVIFGVLQSQTFRQRNLIDAESALQKYRQHLDGRVNIAREIWKWIHLELWFREFVD